MAAAPSATVGLLNLGGCGVLLPASAPDSSACYGLLVPTRRRRVSAAPLGWGLARRGRVFDAIGDGFGAVASGEAGAGSSELRHIEKELTFSPTFTDYVKIMESVKLDRSKSLESTESDGRSSRRRRFTDNGDASVVRQGNGRYIYTTVLDVLGKAKRPFEALNVFYTMLDQLSSYPDMAAYHCIAVTLGQAGLVKELFDVIDRMHSPPKKKFNQSPIENWDPRLEPDLIVYNAVLNACVHQKQWEGAFWVLQQLKEKNIRPTNTTYGLVMEVMLVCGKYNLVYEFFNKVEKTSIPGALNYKVLINALWREGKIDEAVMAVKDMENRGIVGSASLYYDLARCLCSGGWCKDALLQVEKICKVANKPLVVTYTGLIQTCIDNGSMENAKYIFDEMCKYCSPNNDTE
ncbi:hypothetical protein E2562_017837 [Oryza meyeriana var. granulata]|uniref:Pentacotripeptide-repeat region of PRORP domain-containing protein n=1 Tax=Oryza meyeriana var. granulata TaxID=110450 RepID=A0A6G1E0A2_9ORYZ|nr:hypothetical protein E2562_017837 [Oryza meyeriana var. granulata]